MKTLTFDMRDETLAAVRKNPEEFASDMRFTAAATWYTQGRISQEVAASISGLDRADFLQQLGQQQIESFHVDINSLAAELDDD